MKAETEDGDQGGASSVNHVHTVNATTTVGASRMGADHFQCTGPSMVTEMTGFHTISVHVWHLLTVPALKGLGGGRSGRASTGTTFTDSCSSVLAEQDAIRQLVRGG